MTHRSLLNAGYAIAAALLAAIAFALSPWGEALETRLSDARLRMLAPQGEADAVVVVAIDEAALTEIGPWPWPRPVTADFLRRLQAYAPGVIGFDIVFAPLADAKASAPLVEALRDGAAPVVIGQLMLPEPPGGQREQPGHWPILPQPNFPVHARGVLESGGELAAVAGVGHINSLLSPDGIVRRLQPVICAERGCSPGLGLAMILAFLGLSGDQPLQLENREGHWRLRHTDINDALLDLGSDAQIEIPWQTPSPQKYISALEIWQGTAPREMLADKFVLVGGTALGLGDRIATPVAPYLPGVEAHARFIAAWLAGKAGTGTAYPLLLQALALLAEFAALWLCSRKLRRLWLLGTATALGWLLLVAVAYRAQTSLPIMLPTIFPPLALLTLTLWGLNEERRHLGEKILQFLPQPLAESLIKHHLLPAPEAVWSTVLYADLVDYTHFSVNHRPDEVAYWGNAGVDLIIRHIERAGGQIDNIAGDGLLAYWRGGDPKNQARQALTCIRDIARELPLVNATMAAAGYDALQIGIGLHAGPLVAGLFGETRKRYTVLGDVANLAHRLERKTRMLKCSPLVSPAIVELVGRDGMREITLDAPIGPLLSLFHPESGSTFQEPRKTKG